MAQFLPEFDKPDNSYRQYGGRQMVNPHLHNERFGVDEMFPFLGNTAEAKFYKSLAGLSTSLRGTPSDTFTLLGRWAWGPCMAVDVQGNLAVIGNGPSVHIVDVTNPASPEMIGGYVTTGLVADVVIRDNLVYVTDGYGLLVLDISNPHSPQRVGSVAIGGISFQIVVEDSFAYVTTLGGALQIVDIGDPSQPRLRGFAPIGGGNLPACLAVRSRFVYAGSPPFPALRVINATNPDAPTGQFFSIEGIPLCAAIRDTFLFIAFAGDSGKGIKVYNVTNPAIPVFVGQYITSHSLLPFNMQDLVISGPRAYLSAQDFGVYAFDVSDPGQPQLISRFARPFPRGFSGRGLAIANGNLFAGYYTGLLTVDISRPDSMKQVSFFPTGGAATRVTLKDNTAFITTGRSGLWIVDVADPANPRNLSNISTNGFAGELVVADSVVYVSNTADFDADTGKGIWAIDISDKVHPSVLSHYVGTARIPQSYSHLNSIAISGNILLFAQTSGNTNDSTLELVNVSNPSFPQRIGVVHGSYSPYYVRAQDGVAYLATPDSGLIIVDFHEPSLAHRVGRFLTLAAGVAIKDTFMYVPTDTFFVCSISKPTAPVILGTLAHFFTSASSFAMSVSNNYVYWAEGMLGAIDVSNPANPVQRWTFNTSGEGVCAGGNVVYFADNDRGVWILRNDLVAEVANASGEKIRQVALYQNYPNPFNSETTVDFEIPDRSDVLLEMFDVLGRRVKTLEIGERSAGRYRISIKGESLSSGLYILRLTTADAIATRKILLLK